MKGQPNWDSNPVPPSQGSNHSTNWANEAGSSLQSDTHVLCSDTLSLLKPKSLKAGEIKDLLNYALALVLLRLMMQLLWGSEVEQQCVLPTNCFAAWLWRWHPSVCRTQTLTLVSEQVLFNCPEIHHSRICASLLLLWGKKGGKLGCFGVWGNQRQTSSRFVCDSRHNWLGCDPEGKADLMSQHVMTEH